MQHAEKFIDYQNQRGGTYSISSVEKKSDGKCAAITSLKKGFQCAVELEMDVTRALNSLLTDVSDVKAEIGNCEIDDGNKDLLLSQSILVTVNGTTKALNHHVCGDLESKLEKVEYVELGEMIAHDFLGHQLEDTKELANYVGTLEKFGDSESALGSYLVDKHLEL
uniref:Ferritin heavy chain n=1 Tax=Phallusia mammillata TaxID=59560 RepID=A0A6F9DCG6_9ASCI|nr:ferritin heavy chain [Phallusia mammillata]